VKLPDQNQIDHITHNPTEYNVNDVRNLRWCTQAENLNFDEARKNMSQSKSGNKHPLYGRTFDKSPTWKGDEVGPTGLYSRARKLYKAGKITEEEFQKYRDMRQEYQRAKRAKKKQTGVQPAESR
jgi:hypothetical protein